MFSALLRSNRGCANRELLYLSESLAPIIKYYEVGGGGEAINRVPERIPRPADENPPHHSAYHASRAE